MTLREMRVEDLDRVMEIENRVFSDPWSKEGFLGFLMKDYALFFVVEEKEEILGYCGMLKTLDEGDITNVCVRPERRCEGIGYFMLDGMLRIAKDLGVTTVHLEVREGNGSARRLYARCGFTEDGIRKAYYSDPKEDAVLMTRREAS